MSLTLIFVATAIRLEFAADIVPLHDDIELLVMFLLHVFFVASMCKHDQFLCYHGYGMIVIVAHLAS